MANRKGNNNSNEKNTGAAQMKNLNQLTNMQKIAARKELDEKLLALQKVPCIESRIEQYRLIINNKIWNMEVK